MILLYTQWKGVELLAGVLFTDMHIWVAFPTGGGLVLRGFISWVCIFGMSFLKMVVWWIRKGCKIESCLLYCLTNLTILA